MNLKGTVTALVTPFKNGKVDIESLRNLVSYQISSGVQALLACGCTGEPGTLTEEEKLLVIDTVLEGADGAVPVIAGTGTNSTASTVEFTKLVSRKPVQAVLVITPYYNKPTPAGQLVHYTAAAEASEKPLVIYNVPGRTGTCMTVDTLAQLGEHPNIIGVKDAAGSVERVTQLAALSDLTFMSGDDHLALPQIFMGASGVVSVASNAAPGFMSRMVQLGLSGNMEGAREVHEMIYPLLKVLFVETNPSPVKKALQLMGLISDDFPREPLVPVSERSAEMIQSVLEELSML